MFLLTVAAQALAIYLFLVLAMCRVGRTLMAGLIPHDYLIVALLGSAVETGLYRGSPTLWAGLVAAATVLLANYGIASLMRRYPRLRRWLTGGPVVLFHDGRFVESHLRQVGLREEDVRAAARRRGYDDLADVRLAVVEPNGEIGVIPKAQPH